MLTWQFAFRKHFWLPAASSGLHFRLRSPRSLAAKKRPMVKKKKKGKKKVEEEEGREFPGAVAFLSLVKF